MLLAELLMKFDENEKIMLCYQGEYTDVIENKEFTATSEHRNTYFNLINKEVELIWRSEVYRAIMIELG